MTATTLSYRSRFTRIWASALPAVVGLLAVAVVGSTIRAADAPSTSERPGIPDFSAPLEVRQFNAPGFARKAVGVIYDAVAVKQGVPLGGIGTGYVDFNADGTLGVCSIFNRFVPPRKLNRPFLGIVVDGQARLVCLRAADKMAGATAGQYWGHFPVADACYTFDLPVSVEVRGWSPFVLGDAVASNTPAACFEITVRNSGDKAQRVRLVMAFPGPAQKTKATARREAIPGGVTVADAPDADPSAAIALDFTLEPRQSRSATAVPAWHQPHWKDSGGQPHTNRYAERFDGSQAVLRLVAERYDELLRRTLAWQQGRHSLRGSCGQHGDVAFPAGASGGPDPPLAVCPFGDQSATG